jgi:hypothetical protein
MERLGVGVLTSAIESGGHRTTLTVERWDADDIARATRKLFPFGAPPGFEPKGEHFRQLKASSYQTTVDEDCNLVLDAGWNLMMKNVAGSAGTLFSATVGRIGIGDSSTAAAYTQTDLQASSNKYYQLISAAPTVGTTHGAGLVFAATFGTGVANYAWNEFVTDQGTTSNATGVAVCFNRGVSSQGTKLSTQTWSVTETIAWS